jgi:hypothetical protein
MNSPDQIILDPEIDEKTWRVAMGMVMVGVREDLKDIREDLKDVREVGDKHLNCPIDKVALAVFGNGDPEKGLVLKHATLAKEVSIRGSIWGVLGGGGMTAILAFLYYMLSK